MCGATYIPTYSKQRTCGRACGLRIRFGEDLYASRLSKRDLDAPLTAEQRWLERHRKQIKRDYMRSYVGNKYRTCAVTRDRMRNNSARRSAKLRGATHIDNVSLAAIAQRDNNRCHICGQRVAESDRSLDHLIPVSRGGEHVAENLALAHRSCNSSRGAGRLPAQLRLVG